MSFILEVVWFSTFGAVKKKGECCNRVGVLQHGPYNYDSSYDLCTP